MLCDRWFVCEAAAALCHRAARQTPVLPAAFMVYTVCLHPPHNACIMCNHSTGGATAHSHKAQGVSHLLHLSG
jgi:hypothetical protein